MFSFYIAHILNVPAGTDYVYKKKTEAYSRNAIIFFLTAQNIIIRHDYTCILFVIQVLMSPI